MSIPVPGWLVFVLVFFIVWLAATAGLFHDLSVFFGWLSTGSENISKFVKAIHT